MDKKTLKTFVIALACTAAVILMILLSGLQGGTAGAGSADERPGEGKVMILYTSDIHCGVDKGFGLAGLKAVRDRFEAKGYETILVDNGDAIQGDALGTLTKGEAIIKLMNSLEYDLAVPGNHEFDYTADHFLELTKEADFPYICCNLSRNGEQVFDSYKIIEAGGLKIAFVGADTPQSITTSTPAFFEDESGKIIYDFREGGNGQELYDSVQKAVDDARAEGADYVYMMGHLGLDASASPWTYSDVISHTNGIDVFIDGHSHDTEQVVMKNKDGKPVVRTACGTKMQAIGYSELSKDEGIKDTNIWVWNSNVGAPDLLGIDNEMERQVQAAYAGIEKQLDVPVGKADFDLTIYDPVEKDSFGNPIRTVRITETNLGDFCADAVRTQLGTDIGLVNAGNIRTELKKGNITYGDIIEVYPFYNDIYVVEATGQQILDALEWGVKDLPDESGAFLQVSGLTYEADVNVPSSCTKDEEEMMTGVSGPRRVRNVTVGGKPIDPSAKYTVAASRYLLEDHGDGATAFDGATILNESGGLDNKVLMDYIKDRLGGEIGDQYADPYGEGRIKIIQ